MTRTTSTAEPAVDGRSGRVRTVLRAALAVLAVVQGIVGVWAQFAPASFFVDFPLPGWMWVGLLPPYNEHLARDVGGLSLALTLVLVAAAVRVDRWSVRLAAAALLVFAVPHAVFHAFHLEHFPLSDAVIQIVGLVATCLVALAVWVLAGRLPATPPAPNGRRASAT